MNEQTAYALGFFDGVHLGHTALLRACRVMAEENGCRAGVVTFSNHPDALVFGRAPGLIQTPQERDQILHRYVDTVISLPFDRALMTMPWRGFFEMLRVQYHAAGLVCGADFCFGDRGAGNAARLLAACREAGMPCTVVPQQTLGEIPVSSTHIRALLAQGDVAEAARFLGRPYSLAGEVVPGQGLGRKLGTPTANLAVAPGLLLPRFGVYACRAWVDGKPYQAAVNVGLRPTVGAEQPGVEAWLPDFSGDLYGRTLRLDFAHFLRPEQKFETLADLQAEIRKNTAQMREFFAENGNLFFTFA